jgi:hypothetical protein
MPSGRFELSASGRWKAGDGVGAALLEQSGNEAVGSGSVYIKNTRIVFSCTTDNQLINYQVVLTVLA